MHGFTSYYFEIFHSWQQIPLKLVWVIIFIYTILKTKFENFEPKKLIYCNFKQYGSDQFKLDICHSMSAMRTYAAFENNFYSIVDAPKKRKKFTR